MFGNDVIRMFGRALAGVSATKGFDMRVTATPYTLSKI
jgi:hypothetical protein